MHTKAVVAVGIVVMTGLTAGARYAWRPDAAPEVATAVVSRGSIVSAITASGTIEPVTTVQVGTQVSGTVQMLYADFNSIVKRGQVLARLDPSLLQVEIEQARANLVRAEADLERLRVGLQDADAKLARARELDARQLIPKAELDAADAARRTAAAQIRSADAQVTQARATLAQAEVNLAKTVIVSPIDGIVIARSVDVGQTVAASLQAPTLFLIAADLSRMQVKASVDESDLGQIREGQPVTFRVDAYPGEEFPGTVMQVRLNPVVEQNVVTYAAMVDAPNPALKLMPGMTASVTVEVARRDDVLRVPSAALRFRPTEETLAAFGQVAASGAGAAVWVFDGGLHRTPVTVGVSDGVFTEVVAGDLAEGTQVVTSVAPPAAGARSPSSSPLLPSLRGVRS